MRFFIVSLLALVFFASCKKEQPAMRSLEEDCSCAKEVSAAFTMGQYTNAPFSDEFIETDTIHFYMNYIDGNSANFYLSSTVVSFIANIENAISYKWQVGNNSSQQTSRSFSLTFGDTIGTILVTLIVQAKPNLICHPNDDGFDTIKKYLTLKHFKDFPLKGKYEGYNTLNPNSKYVVEIDTFKNPDQGYAYGYGIKGIIPELDNFMRFSSDYRTYSFGGIVDATPDFQDWTYTLYKYNLNDNEFTPIVYDRKTKTIRIKYSIKKTEDFPNGAEQYFERITFTGTKIE
jgi:hypothetical protein